MNGSANSPESSRRCPQCGNELPLSTPPEQCPKCLLAAGFTTGPSPAPGGTQVVTPGSLPTPTQELPRAGDVFGHYRLVRLLGRGGMGAAFDAEDLDTGRRVALKLLSHRLDSPEARARFFREGRLAAMVNHPNSVYVFGTEEIAGTPVIAMELVEGGTLADRVAKRGPLPPGEAVDAVLQIIAGLEAAQRQGILHRDIKPSNCFIDAQGTVKVGDFGLSISTHPRLDSAVTVDGSFLGTPGFSSPEQLRGDYLTVRSDIYAVGVTLFYLLTGRQPFESENLVQLLATILDRPAPSPADFRPGLPPELSRAVTRCLHKNPDQRFTGYEELKKSLLPFSATAPAPANPGIRFLAGWIDMMVLNIPQQIIAFLGLGSWNALGSTEAYRSPRVPLILLANFAVMLVYYAVLEGRWGAGAGKAICKLRVIREDRDTPGVTRALGRAFVFCGLPMLPSFFFGLFAADWVRPLQTDWPMLAVPIAIFLLMAALFTTARKRNGYAAWHDLASGTRVVVRPALPERPPAAVAAEPPTPAAALTTVGPYHVLQKLPHSRDGSELLLGFDPVLLRRIWIRKLLPATPPVTPTIRNLGRPGRLRWLAGKRSETENWDAYEGVDGNPLLAAASGKPGWEAVRFWLLDLAQEFAAAETDGTLSGPLTLDRIWITSDGRARWLDFPAPGTGQLPCPDPAGTPSDLLRQVSQVSLAHASRGESKAETPAGGAQWDTPSVPLPMHAHQLLAGITAKTPPSQIATALLGVLPRPTRVGRGRRLALLVGSAAFPMFAVGIGLAGYFLHHIFAQRVPDYYVLQECLSHVKGLNAQKTPTALEKKEALEIYIAGRFVGVVTNREVWNSPLGRGVLPARERKLAQRIIQERAPVTSLAYVKAEQTVRQFFGKTPDEAARESIRKLNWVFITAVLGYGNGMVFVVIPALVAALLFRGGLLLQLLGIEVVSSSGARASRLRVFWRALLAWLPFLLFPLGLMIGRAALGMSGAAIASVIVVVGFAVLSLLRPERSLQDRMAGTWLVPK